MRFTLGLLGSFSLPTLALAQGGAAGSSGIAGASTGTIPVQIFQLDGKAYNERQVRPINKDECDRNVDITFRLTMLNLVALNAKFLQLWQGPNCNTSGQRDGDTPASECERIPVPDDWTIAYGSDQHDYKTTVSGLCKESDGTMRDGELPFYFLPVQNTTDVTDVAVFGQYEISIDQTPPGAPGNVTVGKGETEIPVDWEPADNMIQSNWLVWDTNPVDGGETTSEDGGTSNSGAACSSSILRAGDETSLEDLRMHDGIRMTEVVGNRDHTTISAQELGVSRAALAILATDIADNVS
ncbi:MAG TPA: hypothetical protein VJR89_13980, partial [Polyangiales bacterium]|nr:hypothetical protein [Polyangiales bacterium]